MFRLDKLFAHLALLSLAVFSAQLTYAQSAQALKDLSFLELVAMPHRQK
mgnify:CR=1 FL=1